MVKSQPLELGWLTIRAPALNCGANNGYGHSKLQVFACIRIWYVCIPFMIVSHEATLRTFRTALAETNDLIWDRMLGIDTAGDDCRPTAYHVLRKILAALPLQPDDVFIDIGCGRGRVLCLAAQRPIARAAGVEITPHHAAAAQRNLQRLRGRKAHDSSVFCGSAADFDLSGGTVFYLYNPFGGALFAQVAGNIRDAAMRGQRPVRLVYVNPVCRDVLDATDWLSAPDVIYADRAGKPAALLYRSL